MTSRGLLGPHSWLTDYKRYSHSLHDRDTLKAVNLWSVVKFAMLVRECIAVRKCLKCDDGKKSSLKDPRMQEPKHEKVKVPKKSVSYYQLINDCCLLIC